MGAWWLSSGTTHAHVCACSCSGLFSLVRARRVRAQAELCERPPEARHSGRAGWVCLYAPRVASGQTNREDTPKNITNSFLRPKGTSCVLDFEEVFLNKTNMFWVCRNPLPSLTNKRSYILKHIHVDILL